MIEKVPAVFVEVGAVLVAVGHSCISIGTERKGLCSGGLPLWKRSLPQPENVRQAFHSAMAIVPRQTWSLVRGPLAVENATGYPAVGMVGEHPGKGWDGPVVERIVSALAFPHS